jgi:hypothetical protein
MRASSPLFSLPLALALQVALASRRTCEGSLLSFLVQFETLAANERSKILPFGCGDLTGLVLRPTIERWFSETLDLTPIVLRDVVTRIAATVVAVDLDGKVCVVVAVDMHRQCHGQAQADKSLA